MATKRIKAQWEAAELFLALYETRPEIAAEEIGNRAALKRSKHCPARAHTPASYRWHGTPLCGVCFQSVLSRVLAELRSQQLIIGGVWIGGDASPLQ